MARYLLFPFHPPLLPARGFGYLQLIRCKILSHAIEKGFVAQEQTEHTSGCHRSCDSRHVLSHGEMYT